MLRGRLAVLIIFMISAFVPTVHAQHGTVSRILFISSYDPSFPTFSQQINGLNSVFEGKNYILDVEYMDSKRFYTEENLGRFAESLSYKLKKLPLYNVVIIADDNALRLWLSKRDSFGYGGVPVVFFGINNTNLALQQNLDPTVSGIIEAVSIEDTLDLVSQLFPYIKKVAVLSDATPSGEADMQRFRAAAEIYGVYDYSYLSLKDYSWDELPGRLLEIKRDSAVFLLSAYRDKNGKNMHFYEGLDYVRRNLNAPIFHLWSHGIGEGILGGKVISHYDQAAEAASMALEVITGSKDISGFTVSSKEKNYYIFDYNEMKIFGLAPGDLPAGSRVLNTPQTFWHQNKALVIAAAAVIIMLSMLLLLAVKSILERKKVEESLRSSEEKYKSLFYNNKSVMLIINPEDGKIVDFNNSALEFYGYSRTEMQSLYITDLNINNPLQIRRDMHDAEKNRKGYFCFKHRTSSGFIKDVEVYSGPIIINGSRFLYTIVHDISDKNNYLRRMNEARLMAEHAMRIKNDFLANISHELRTPMNGIIGMLKLLENAQYGDAENEWYKMACLSAENLRMLIEELLTVTLLDTGKLKIINKPFELESFIENTVSRFEEQAAAKGIVLRLRKKNLSRFFTGDETRISQIANNLLSNAVKYSDKGTVIFELERKDDILVIRVSDEGKGISEEELDDIFQPFRQLESTYDKKHKGTGLGLAIVKNTLMLMNGEIEVVSKKENGTEFIVRIPGSFLEELKSGIA